MNMELSPIEKRLIALLSSEGLPLTKRPFRVLGEKLGLKEEEVLRIIESLRKRKIIRRFGATVRHDLSGYRGNVMVAWKVPEERLEEVGRRCATYPFITHCYVRKTTPSWPFNFYTMIHAQDEKKCKDLIEKLAQQLELEEYQMLFTQKEILRRTRKYFELNKEE